jgi:TonB family protein
VSSATDSTPPVTQSVTASEINSKRPNPVALKAMVNVTGARQSVSGGSRDLFSEDTTTVLVFRDGAVIRLDAGVAIGQLLFIKHKKTNREVVCQVLHKRNYKPTSCYVELQFTEDKPDFWGVAFPAVKAGSAEFKLKEQVEAEETTADDQGGAVAPRTNAEVDKLRKELEELREQLKNLEKQKAPEAARVQTPDSPSATLPTSHQPAQNAAPATMPTASPKPQPSVPDATAAAPWAQAPKSAPSPPRPMVGMTLPTQKPSADKRAENPKDSVDAFLPKPALDFSKIPKPQHGEAHTPGMSLPHLDPKKILLIALSLVALVVVAFAWWRHSQIAKPPQLQSPTASASAPGQVPTVPKSPASANSQPATLAPQEQKAAVSALAATETLAASNSKLNAALPASGSASLRANRNSAATPRPKARSASKRNPADASTHATSPSATNTTTTDSGATDANVTPAKLLKAASPVYPPNAMRNYITGDVRASVVVDSNGHVQNVEVLSGPQALRSAAVEALKQYQYAPATQSGKPVSSKAVVTVKFWFNP